MTYCLGIITREGLVMASDSRTNSGHDQANTTRKMYSFVIPGERVLILMTSGNLSLSQSVITLLRQDFDRGKGLAVAESMYEASRILGATIRRVAAIDGASLKDDGMKFNVNVIMGGQIKGESPSLYLVYPQGNPLHATKDCCFLQIGEVKYGKPILDRGVSYAETSLAEAVKYAALSMDATMRSNVTVGAPVDLIVYHADTLDIRHQRRLHDSEDDWNLVHSEWEQALRRAVGALPDITFEEGPVAYYVPKKRDQHKQTELPLHS